MGMGNVTRHLRVRNKQIEALCDYIGGGDVPLADLTANVPCGDCSACCHMRVELFPRESGDGLDFELLDGVRRLRQNPDGSCIHLVAGRCSVHDHRPVACRRYDCRDYVVCGLVPSDQPKVAAKVMRWRPQFNSDADRDAFLRTRNIAHGLAIHEGAITDIALFTAIQLHDKSYDEIEVELTTKILPRLDSMPGAKIQGAKAASTNTNSTTGDQTHEQHFKTGSKAPEDRVAIQQLQSPWPL
jgi:hypothetical protein